MKGKTTITPIIDGTAADFGGSDLTALISSTDKRIESLERSMRDTLRVIDKILDILVSQRESISDIRQEIYELAPEKPLIDTMAEDEAERQQLLAKYLNRNEHYYIGEDVQ